MKTIFKFFKTLLYSIWPTLAGFCIAGDIHCIIRNIRAINTGSGWNVVLSFVLVVMEITLAIILLYELGWHQINSKNWVEYKKAIDAQTTDSSSCDCETSNEATDTSSDAKSKSKRKKS
jgi:hypothetical protein